MQKDSHREMARKNFELASPFQPCGDQPKAIDEIIEAFARSEKHQTLLGVTGSGKTFTVANVISQMGLPALIIAHNKTLAAQLYGEFKSLFPKNAVEYFVSYYDYYQPEAYVPSSDTFIDKDATINDAIDRMRHSATRALLERQDVIIISSVSCIYGLGSAEAYYDQLVHLKVGACCDRDTTLRRLVDIQYERNEIDFHRGTFRVRGDVVEIFPAHEQERAVRIEWFGDEIDSIVAVDPLRGIKLEQLNDVAIYPTSHYVVDATTRARALGEIRTELQERLGVLQQQDKRVEAQRLEQRTMFDLEMIEQIGYCTGIENYSRHLTGRCAGEPPPTLMDYFPDDFLLMVDESHQTISQIGAMYRGDRSRKETLVTYGFRLPSALDNRPLQFNEFEALVDKALYVSATPGEYEIERSKGVVVEQMIRPTGLLDPPVEVRPATHQVDDLLAVIRERIACGQRVLVTTLTKRMAEDLTEYYADAGVKVRYMHSDIDTLERVEIIRGLRLGTFDVLVGINLLREGLDLPEVSLVAILDADKEGFLRSARSLVQTIGRAARHIDGRVLMYADRRTRSMCHAIDETQRRRCIQAAHNKKHGISPRSVKRALSDVLPEASATRTSSVDLSALSPAQLSQRLERVRKKMMKAAESLDFETAAQYRDEMQAIESLHLGINSFDDAP